MSCHDMERHLHDYLDRALDADGLATLEEHLSGCAACRALLTEMQALEAEVAGLRDLQPERDLWPALEAKLEARANPAIRRFMPGLAAAAAAIIVAITVMMQVPTEPATTVKHTPTAESALAEIRAAEAEYINAAERLAKALENGRDALDPETTRVIEQNLEVINVAIAEARLALDDQPENHRLARWLNELQREKVHLLSKVMRLTIANQKG